MTVRPYEPAFGPAVDLEMMQSPERWPQRPALPLNRATEKGLECGLLVDTEGPVRPTVYLGNLVMIALGMQRLAETGTCEYPTFEALQADGWVVD